MNLIHFCVFVAFSAGASGKTSQVTYKNVTLRAYSFYTYKFNVTIEASNSLKEHLPRSGFDMIEIVDSSIPVLYTNSIADIDSLDELILDTDNIMEIQPGAFKNVDQLRKVVIKGNNIEEIKEGVFNNLKISTLDLSDNGIISIASKAFDNMPDLLNIKLADNKLKKWNENWFANTPLLTRTSFQNNLIEEIPSEAFQNFKGHKQFGSVPLTVNIILSHNKIRAIHEDAFKGLDKINNLWLDNNAIENWNESLLRNAEVNDLRLHDNKITCLSGNLEKILVATTTHLDGNPWNCQCLNNVDTWATEHKKDVQVFYSKLTCDVERIDKKIKSLNKLLKELKAMERRRRFESFHSVRKLLRPQYLHLPCNFQLTEEERIPSRTPGEPEWQRDLRTIASGRLRFIKEVKTHSSEKPTAVWNFL